MLADGARADLGKSAIEAYTTEIGFVIDEIDHTLDRLDEWCTPRRVGVADPPAARLRPASSPNRSAPCLIIAPWNYPLQLLLAPLVPALAAGNTACSSRRRSPRPPPQRSTELRLPTTSTRRWSHVVTGGVDETTALLAERFDHIFYTGNGTVGKIVMRAAAEHLTPVTLELGGKSPAIVTDHADSR